jgi:hypothetical protein
LDVVSVGGIGLYLVIFQHTSALSFDPGANDGSGHNFYQLLLQQYGVAVKTVTAATFTPDISYANTYIRCTNSGGCTVTIPPDSSVNWADFPFVEMHVRDCSHAGVVDFDAGAGVTLNGIHSRLLQTAAVGAVVTLKRVDVNTWDVFGLLTPGSP